MPAIEKKVIDKKSVALTPTQVIKLGVYSRLKRVAAHLKNKLTARQADIVTLTGASVTLDKSKTEWKMTIENFAPCELTAGNQLVATLIECSNPPLIDTDYLRTHHPELAEIVIKPNGKHVRLNIKK